MDKTNLKELSFYGGVAGCGLAVIPATCAFFVTYSKVIFVNWMVNIPLRILSGGHVKVCVHGVSLVHAPFLWRVSLISAKIGGLVLLVSLIVGLADYAFKEYNRKRW